MEMVLEREARWRKAAPNKFIGEHSSRGRTKDRRIAHFITISIYCSFRSRPICVWVFICHSFASDAAGFRFISLAVGLSQANRKSPAVWTENVFVCVMDIWLEQGTGDWTPTIALCSENLVE